MAHDVNEFDIPVFYHETVQQLAVKVNIPYSTVLKNKTVKSFCFLNFFKKLFCFHRNLSLWTCQNLLIPKHPPFFGILET